MAEERPLLKQANVELPKQHLVSEIPIGKEVFFWKIRSVQRGFPDRDAVRELVKVERVFSA